MEKFAETLFLGGFYFFIAVLMAGLTIFVAHAFFKSLTRRG